MINYQFEESNYLFEEFDSSKMFSINKNDSNSDLKDNSLLQQQQQQQQQKQTLRTQLQNLEVNQSNEQEINEQSNGKRKHCVWNYYDLLNGKARCKACSRRISATTTLAKGHLKAFHIELFAQVEQKEEERREFINTNLTPKKKNTFQHDVSNSNIGSFNDSYSRINSSTESNYNLHKTLPIVQMCRVECFSASHRLHNHNLTDAQNREIYGKCNNLNGHGHNYEWKVVLEGRVNPVTGMVYDLGELKSAMNEVLLLVDHKNLDIDNDYFRNNHLVSTTENLAIYLYHQIKTKLKSPELLKKVVVSETNKNQFSYSGR